MKSVLAEHGWKLSERGISYVPIAPGTKKPGQHDSVMGWSGMGDWTRFSERHPTALETEIWETWPGAGLGVTLGPLSNLLAIDWDNFFPNGGTEALLDMIPHSPVVKKGAKGWTRFYRYNGERSCSFDVGGVRVLDVLSFGRQTVIPPTMHPDGFTYAWLSVDTLFEIESAADLPALPDDFLTQVELVLKPFQTDDDKRVQHRPVPTLTDGGTLSGGMSIQAQFFRDLNNLALLRMDEWVPRFVPRAQRESEGYRCWASWRGAANPNVSVHPAGIRDWGGGYGMTPIDLVMNANNITAMQAADALRLVLMAHDDKPLTMTVGGVAIGAEPPAAPPPAAPPAPPPPPPEPPAPPPPPPPDEPPQLPRCVTNAPGMLREVADWIVATAAKPQPELALSAAIALGATLMQRVYRTDQGNWSSLFVVMVGMSGEGKEHPLASVDKVLQAAGYPQLVAGSGYTSAGAVYSALLRAPSHLALIDEFGKLVKLSRSKGNANGEAALDKLVEVFGRVSGILRPPSYSTMTLSKSQAAAVQSQEVHNPAITVLGASTPATFYESLPEDLVQDGFVNRLLVVESNLPMQNMRLRGRVDGTNVPQRLVSWAKALHSPPGRVGNLTEFDIASLPAQAIGLPFTEACIDMLEAFNDHITSMRQRLAPERLDGLLVRTTEKAMRLSMVAAKALDVNAKVIGVEALAWSLEYVEHYDMALVASMRTKRVTGQFDVLLRKLCDYVKGATKLAQDPKLSRFAPILAMGGVPRQLLLRRMHMTAKEFDQLVATAYESGLLNRSQPGEITGYAGDVYFPGDVL